jgi:sterol desaturase/sphingolipid hydroxylase (fatty acid hydroxylase superfamily)
VKPPLSLPLTVAGVFLVLFAAERAFPLRRPAAGLFARLVVNAAMSLVAFTVAAMIVQANTLFHHSNVRLPVRMERLLNRVLVTPRMHGIHHSQVRHETNSNYGVVFCWWDRLHRTLGLNVPQAHIEVGIPGYSRPDDNRFWHTVMLPFRKQRDYWRRPDGTVPLREPAGLQVSEPRLIE